jgi:hypothetical protein
LPVPKLDIQTLIRSSDLVIHAQTSYVKQFAIAVTEGRIDKLVINEIQHAVSNAVDHPATVEALKAISEVEIRAMPMSMMMDDHADVEWVFPPNGAGAPAIYFINGIDTKTDEGLEEASAIAEKFERPVGLIYNQTHGRGQDLVESAYDRSWAVAPFLPGTSQANKATRQAFVLLARTAFFD